MMKFKKALPIIIIVMIILISACVVYFSLINHSNDYKKIGHDTKLEITAQINSSRINFQDLGTDNCFVSWIPEAYTQQEEIMDKVIDNLRVLGETEDIKPRNYIEATYDNGDMRIYILYHEKSAYKKLIVEIKGQYYVAVAHKKDVNTVINYMINNEVLDIGSYK